MHYSISIWPLTFHWIYFFRLSFAVIVSILFVLSGWCEECSQMLYSKKRQRKMINTSLQTPWKSTNTMKEHDMLDAILFQYKHNCDLCLCQRDDAIFKATFRYHTRSLFLSFSPYSAIHCVSPPHEHITFGKRGNQRVTTHAYECSRYARITSSRLHSHN